MANTNEPRKRVIFFDDDEDTLALCAYILKNKGWEVSTFINCNNIVETVITVFPSVIFIDNRIPDIGGIGATKLLKENERTRHIPVIFFSAHSDIRNLSAQAGADNFISKPFEIPALVAIAEKYA